MNYETRMKPSLFNSQPKHLNINIMDKESIINKVIESAVEMTREYNCNTEEEIRNLISGEVDYAYKMNDDVTPEQRRALAQALSEAVISRRFKENRSPMESFNITSVSRADLEEKGYDTSAITDEQMQKLASKMADDYCEQLFWTSMDIIAENLGFPKKARYTVWVGGGEVNDELLTKDQAEKLAEDYRSKGYDDVKVEEV